MSHQDRVKTGIESFDVLIPGGFRKNQNIVVSGPSGSGKTIFGLQVLVSRAKKFGESGVYVSSNRNPDDIIEDCKIFGWDLQELIDKGKLAIVDARPFKKEDDYGKFDESLYRGEDVPFDHLTQLIRSTANKIHANCIVIDSITTLCMNYTDEFYINQGIQNMFQILEESQCTCIVISDRKPNESHPVEWSLASGVISFSIKNDYGIPKRNIQILKVKGSFHSEDTYLIQLTDKGLMVIQPKNS